MLDQTGPLRRSTSPRRTPVMDSPAGAGRGEGGSLQGGSGRAAAGRQAGSRIALAKEPADPIPFSLL